MKIFRAIIRIMFLLIAIIFPMMLLNSIRHYFSGDPEIKILIAFFSILLLIISYNFSVKLVEKRKAFEFHLPCAGSEFSAGIIIGAILFSFSVVILVAFRSVEITGSNPDFSFLLLIPSFFLSALYEEIIFRAIIFRTLEDFFGSQFSLITSAIIFGLMHLYSPGSNIFVAISISVEAGLMLAVAYMLTRRVWLCTGIHFGWNFTQGGLFSLPVSGNTYNGLLRLNLHGPAWLTGGEFGVEASLIAVCVCFLAGAFMFYFVLRKRNFILWKDLQTTC